VTRDHEVLGVSPGAAPAEVRAAFRRFARAHHPDQGGDPVRFQAGLDAYRRLLGLSPLPGVADVVFHRRPRGLELLAAAWRARRQRRRRSARVI
jgi:hypothetical protein